MSREGKSDDAATPDNAVSGLDPVEAFDLLAHEVRLGIIRELAAVRRTNWQWRGMEFAELRRAVGAEDAGNFSYHLGKLRDHFVVKEGAEYKLTFAGMKVAGAVIAGTYTERSGGSVGTVDVACPDCGEPMTARYEHEFLGLSCEEHGTVFGTALPPGAAEGRSLRDLVALATMDARQDVERALSGVCPHCWGPVTTRLPVKEVVDAATGEPAEVPREDGWVEFDCGRCEMVFWLPPGACVVDAPPVVALLHEHGVDPRERSYAELPFTRADAGVVESADPVRVRVDVTVDDDTLHLWLDGAADVVEYERA